MFDLQLHNICVKDLVRAHVASPQSLASPDGGGGAATDATHENLLCGFLYMPAIVVRTNRSFYSHGNSSTVYTQWLNGISFRDVCVSHEPTGLVRL